VQSQKEKKRVDSRRTEVSGRRRIRRRSARVWWVL